MKFVFGVFVKRITDNNDMIFTMKPKITLRL